MRKIFNHLSHLRPNHRDKQGRTALYRAAKHGNMTEVKKLLSIGADPNIPNNKGLTPLHQAAYWGELEVARALLAAGADPKVTNGKGWTPLHSASLAAGLSKRRRVIQLLLKLGADPHAPDKYGWTPVDYTSLWEDQNPKLVKVLDFLRQKSNSDDFQQPDMGKLGMDKAQDNAPSDKNKKHANESRFPRP